MSEATISAKQVKENLVTEAERLQSSTDWGATAGVFRDLMTQWKAAGRASRADDDALWARFRAAQDAFFDAKDAVVAAEEDGLTKPRAFVVVRDAARARLADAADRDRLADELREHVKQRLSKHKYPRWIEFVDDLPKNDRGKVDRKQLAAAPRTPA